MCERNQQYICRPLHRTNSSHWLYHNSGGSSSLLIDPEGAHTSRIQQTSVHFTSERPNLHENNTCCENMPLSHKWCRRRRHAATRKLLGSGLILLPTPADDQQLALSGYITTLEHIMLSQPASSNQAYFLYPVDASHRSNFLGKLHRTHTNIQWAPS